MVRQAIQATAFHEAGHAAAMLYLGYTVEKASIVETEDYLGAVKHSLAELQCDADVDRSPDVVEKLEQLTQICFAGPIAQRKQFPRSHWSATASADFSKADSLLGYLSWTDAKADKLYRDLIWRRTELLVGLIWPSIEALAEALLVSKDLYEKEVREIFERAVGKGP